MISLSKSNPSVTIILKSAEITPRMIPLIFSQTKLPKKISMTARYCHKTPQLPKNSHPGMISIHLLDINASLFCFLILIFWLNLGKTIKSLKNRISHNSFFTTITTTAWIMQMLIITTSDKNWQEETVNSFSARNP